MNTHNDNAAPSPLRRWAGALAIAAAVGSMAFASAGPAIHGMAMAGHHQGQHMAMEAHIHQFIADAVADGTPEQKAAVNAILKSAQADLRPLHEQMAQGHVRAHQLLTAPAIDRAALEELRVQQMQQMDLISKRILAAVEDAAEVLTPAQRARLGGHPAM